MVLIVKRFMSEATIFMLMELNGPGIGLRSLFYSSNMKMIGKFTLLLFQGCQHELARFQTYNSKTLVNIGCSGFSS
jgi:hypothetical protein